MAAIGVSVGSWRRHEVVISCEHASARIPARYRGLGLSPSAIESHIGWDRGAPEVARGIARALKCPHFEARHSRLLIDLNRSVHHRRVIPKTNFGQTVPGNQQVDREERRLRIERYYAPYRREVETALRDVIERHGRAIHLSIHSFTSRLNGVERNADIGLLYDSACPSEKEFSRRWAASLREAGLRVRFNYPYRGRADGFTTHCRKLFTAATYLGIELEMNQSLFGGRSNDRLSRRLVQRLMPPSE